MVRLWYDLTHKMRPASNMSLHPPEVACHLWWESFTPKFATFGVDNNWGDKRVEFRSVVIQESSLAHWHWAHADASLLSQQHLPRTRAAGSVLPQQHHASGQHEESASAEHCEGLGLALQGVGWGGPSQVDHGSMDISQRRRRFSHAKGQPC